MFIFTFILKKKHAHKGYKKNSYLFTYKNLPKIYIKERKYDVNKIYNYADKIINMYMNKIINM